MSKRTSASLPIILGVTTVGLTLAMLVAWIIVMVQTDARTRAVAQNTRLLILGSGALGVIISGLVLMVTLWVRETREIRRQDSFIDSVTHELKSPLASLRLCLETLGRPTLLATHRAQLEAVMLDDVARLGDFIDDVLAASRLSQHRSGNQAHEVDVSRLLTTLTCEIRARYRKLGPQIQVTCPPAWRLVCDETALGTACKNLIDNAVKYSDPPANIRVFARRAQNAIEICVEDEGIGIAQQHAPRVFQRFFRVPSEATRRRRGTGLGLFVAQELLRELGGRVIIRSAGVNLGTRAVVRLPLRRFKTEASPGL